MWLDEHVVTLVSVVPIEDPCRFDEVGADWELGWAVRLVETDEILTVHSDTLDELVA
tara:strand:- start:603 stop:773 length:171 start_codon:yes stop_codon:yes gene_type:complete